jgi:hypothetical protein
VVKKYPMALVEDVLGSASRTRRLADPRDNALTRLASSFEEIVRRPVYRGFFQNPAGPANKQPYSGGHCGYGSSAVAEHRVRLDRLAFAIETTLVRPAMKSVYVSPDSPHSPRRFPWIPGASLGTNDRERLKAARCGDPAFGPDRPARYQTTEPDQERILYFGGSRLSRDRKPFGVLRSVAAALELQVREERS